jgi:hypothetical protein
MRGSGRFLSFRFLERKGCLERNFVRNAIIPWMEKLNPAFREKVVYLLGDLTSANAVFDHRQGNSDTVARHGNGDISMSVKGLACLDRRLLQGGGPSY